MFIVVVTAADGRLGRRGGAGREAVLCIELEEVWCRAELRDEGLEVVGGEHRGGCMGRAEMAQARQRR